MVRRWRKSKAKPTPADGWPYRVDPLETADRAMDMQQTLFELAQKTNVYYRPQLLIMILTAFVVIVFKSYGILDLLLNRSKSLFNTTLNINY